MVRPFKQGVDYFPLDVHMDNKFKFIEVKFGLEGFAIVIKMLQNVYSQGYWCAWGEDEKLLFASDNNVDITMLETVTEECLKRRIFDYELYEKHCILTSSGIQKRYKEIVRRRKDVKLTDEYLLIDGDFGVNDVIKSSESKHNDGNNEQRKGKETRKEIETETEKEIKEQEIISQIENLRLRYSEEQQKVIDRYLEMIKRTRQNGKIADSVILKMFEDWDKHPTICVEHGLRVHTDNEKYHSKKEQYTLGIIRNTNAEEASQYLQRNEVNFSDEVNPYGDLF